MYSCKDSVTKVLDSIIRYSYRKVSEPLFPAAVPLASGCLCIPLSRPLRTEIRINNKNGLFTGQVEIIVTDRFNYFPHQQLYAVYRNLPAISIT